MNDSSSATANEYRKKPVVITAVQWFKQGDHPEVQPHGYGLYDPLSLVTCGSCGQDMFLKASVGGGVGRMIFTHGEIKTLESAKGSAHVVCPGDWIIKGVKGEHYACKPDIFATTYEPASTTSSAATEYKEGAWIGCQECDVQFICHGGEHPCVRAYRSKETLASSTTESSQDAIIEECALLCEGFQIHYSKLGYAENERTAGTLAQQIREMKTGGARALTIASATKESSNGKA